MANSRSNLDISISADTAAARTDIKLLEDKLRSLRKEYRTTIADFKQTGDRRALDQLSATILQNERALASMRQEVNRTSSAVDYLATKPMRRLVTQFDNFGKTAQNLAQVFGGIAGGFAGGFASATVVMAVRSLFDALDDLQKKLLELRDMSQQTLIKPEVIEASRRIAALAGRDAADADKMMKSGAESFAKFKTEAGKPIDTSGIKDLTQRTKEGTDAVKEATSEFTRGVQVQRGAARITFDLAEAEKMIGINAKDYKGTVEDQLRFIRDRNKAFVDFAAKSRLGAVALNELSKALFEGLPADAALKVAPKLVSDLDKQIKDFQTTQASIDLAEETKAQQARVQAILEGQKNSLVDWRNSVNLAFNQWLADFLGQTLPKWWEGVKASFTNFWPDLQREWNASWARLNESLKRDFGATVEEMLAAATGAFGRAVDWMIQKWNQIRSAVGSLPGTTAAGDMPPMPFASGGMVPGRGLGDTVRAWLTPGEFVIRRSVVDALGADFFAGLNRGMGLPGRSHFAAGGLVSDASATAAVHLHLDGQQFAMRADQNVAESLMRTARAKQMLSAGRKPSWAGGRRYGG
ncbi:MAG TPA: hypothetical protein VJ890_21135 [Vineibacter sp.]|nr:hypothetical protein [Vineibacter sp.]